MSIDWQRNILRSAVFLLVFALTIEVSARIHDALSWNIPLLGSHDAGDLTAIESGYRICRPYAKLEWRELDETGFRKVDVESPENPDYDVAILGASEMFGIYESPGHDVPSMVSKLLNDDPTGTFQVINSTCPGISLPSKSYIFETRIKDLNPDVVVVYPTPHFYLDEAVPGRRTGRPDTILKPRGAVEWELRSIRRLRAAVKRVLPSELATYLRRTGVERTISAQPDSWFWPEVPPERVDAFESHLRALVESIEATGSKVVLATHANRFGTVDGLSSNAVHYEYWWRKFYPRASLEALMGMDDMANEVVREMSRAGNYCLADVAEVASSSTLNFHDFSHFTDAGAAIVAEEMAQAVRRSALDQCAPGPT